MMNKTNTMNSRCESFLDVWRSVYCLVIPIIVTVVFLLCYCKADIKIWKSENFSATLSSVITFVSIIISFFGVLLTLLITAKEKSEFIQFFLESADKKAFVTALKRLIMFGLLAVIIAACLFLEDIMVEKLIVVFLCIEVFSLVKFTTLTYRFTCILLLLFIRDKDDFRKREGTQLPEYEKKELIERINNGI